MSSRPNSSSMNRESRSTLPGSATSSCRTTTTPGSPAAALLPCSSSREPTTTVWPRSASWRQTSSPIPLFPPLTSAIRPFSNVRPPVLLAQPRSPEPRFYTIIGYSSTPVCMVIFHSPSTLEYTLHTLPFQWLSPPAASLQRVSISTTASAASPSSDNSIFLVSLVFLTSSCVSKSSCHLLPHRSGSYLPSTKRHSMGSWDLGVFGQGQTISGWNTLSSRPTSCVSQPRLSRSTISCISDRVPYSPPTAMITSPEHTTARFRACPAPVATEYVRYSFCLLRSSSGRMPMAVPPASAAPRAVASITPERPPQTTMPPLPATSLPTSRAFS